MEEESVRLLVSCIGRGLFGEVRYQDARGRTVIGCSQCRRRKYRSPTIYSSCLFRLSSICVPVEEAAWGRISSPVVVFVLTVVNFVDFKVTLSLSISPTAGDIFEPGEPGLHASSKESDIVDLSLCVEMLAGSGVWVKL